MQRKSIIKLKSETKHRLQKQKTRENYSLIIQYESQLTIQYENKNNSIINSSQNNANLLQISIFGGGKNA